ncbi:MAG TPA: TrkA family potassium uptake protein [Tepidiformaceae bacterium]|nr:TrkA family potassium uptake protein [Tepidiformaceae bacterium]
MNVLIMGCGRLGAQIAMMLDEQGHRVTVMDTTPASFRRLRESFGGVTVLGNGMDAQALERAGVREVEAFFAVTQGDNRNYFASQMAKQVYLVPRVLCRIYDPGREKIFRELGLETFSPTSMGARVMVNMLLGAPQEAN